MASSSGHNSEQLSKAKKVSSRGHQRYWLRRLLVTGMFLCFGCAIGGMVGIASAEFYPATDLNDTPILQQWIQRIDLLVKHYRQGDQVLITLPSDNLFVDGQSRLRAEGVLILNQVAKDIAQYPGTEIMVVVHTDSISTAMNVRQLSLMQARSVQLYLTKKLGNNHQWIVVGSGDSRPLVKETTDSGQQRNRRVELLLFPTKQNSL